MVLLACCQTSHACLLVTLASGRDLKTISARVGGAVLRVATTHLESPTGSDALHSEQRQAQAKQSLAVLERAPEPDVLFAGDMVGGGIKEDNNAQCDCFVGSVSQHRVAGNRGNNVPFGMP
jgi:hypothetical protein